MITHCLPLITCVCVTKNRINLLKKAIGCYLKQSYPNKNLVILSQGSINSNQDIKSFIASLQRNDITFVSAPESLSLGAMRNTSVELATGEIICQWDDDDLYHPDRVLTQYKNLISDTRNIASVYSSFLKLFNHNCKLYWCDWFGEPKFTHKFLCGSIMFHKKAFHMYRQFYPENGHQSKVEEDLHVLEKLNYKGGIAAVTAAHQYIYIFHGSNTYDINHHMLTLNTTWGKKVLTKLELEEKKSLLEATFNLLDLQEKVHVSSIDEICYTFNDKGTTE